MYILNTPLNIVLTDDDQDDRELFCEALSRLNFKTNLTTYKDAYAMVEGLKSNQANLPDVIFLDINMPGKTGLDCLKELKQDALYKDLPIIMFTTSVRIMDVDEAGKLGANLFLNKPSEFNELVALLNKIITPTGLKLAENQGISEA